MKKFLIFLVAIIVAVCMGLTTYYFLRNDEVITVGTKEIYCNVDDVIYLEELNIKVVKKSKKTKYNYNAGDEEVLSHIEYDSEGGYYKAKKGGNTSIVISTTNKKFKKLEVMVHIGDGQEESPYYLSSEADLKKIGNIYDENACFSLRNDIVLSKTFQPIGIKEDGLTFTSFGGKFFGNGHSISGLNLDKATYTNAGLFYELNNATVKDLTIRNTTIVGGYDNIGTLAGKASGTIERINVVNTKITKNQNAGTVGGLVGSIEGQNSVVSMCGAKGVTIEVTSASNDIQVGGLIGRVSESMISSTYATTDFVIDNSIVANVGGLVGEFKIGQTSGNIQHSYAVANSNYTNLGAFVGKISTLNGFDASTVNTRRFFIGNYVALNGKSAIKNDESTVFNTLSDKVKHLYLIEGLTSENDLKNNDEFIFYAVGDNASDKVLWNISIWTIQDNKLPELKFIETTDVSVSNEYLTRDLNSETVGDQNAPNTENVEKFVEIFAKDNDGVKYVLKSDVDLTGVDWTPHALTNSIIDGQGHVIKGLNIKNASNGLAGLFSYIDNSTIKNLIFEDTIVDVNADNVGVLAGEIRSSDQVAVSTIQNVVVKNTAIKNATINNFGLIAGKMVKGNLLSNAVRELTIADQADIKNIAGFVAVAEEGYIEDSVITYLTISGKENVAGLVAINNATINGVFAEVGIVHNNDSAAANIGGLIAQNNKDIQNIVLEANIIVKKAVNTNYIGGIAGINNGTISNAKLTGKGIAFEAKTGAVNYVGGVAGAHNGQMNNVYCHLENVGTMFDGEQMYVGGIAGRLNGNVTQAIAGSNLQGNYVGGIASTMNKTQAIVDQVLVGKYAEGKVSDIVIEGNVHVANLACDLVAGTMKNIQCSSELKGGNNSTQISLVVVMLQDKAVVRNVTVDSALNGHGTFYLETRNDIVEGNGTRPNNIYEERGHNTGIMESVVINTSKAKANGLSYKSAEVIAQLWGSTYESSGNKNFVKPVNNSEFASASTFKGSYSVKATFRLAWIIPINHSWNRNLSFDFANQIWTENFGIQLTFLSNI
ncbi:MAG: hypothetical protein IKA36_03545 [Clostridia bacterium]|nr:hypothetical protein [Clostridia bacterium]